MHIQLRAEASSRTHSVMMVLDSKATDQHAQEISVSAFAVVNLVPQGQLASLSRQLVSGYRHADGSQQCLEASRLKKNLQPLEPTLHFLGLSGDNLQLKLAADQGDPALAVKLAPCDAERMGQLWRYDETLRLLIDKTDRYFLDISAQMSSPPRPNQALLLSARRLPASHKATPLVRPLWLRQGLRFAYQPYPGFVLSEMRGKTPRLAATRPSSAAHWQQWTWY